MAAVEQVAAGVTQLPPQRTEGVPGSIEDRPVPADTEVVLLPPPLPSQRRVAVPKRLQPRSSRKRPTEVTTLAPLKALKVSPSSTALWVVEAQAAKQRGAASARANLKEPVALGGAAEVTPTQTGEGAPLPRGAEACDSDGAVAPSFAEATEVEAPRASEAEATEAEAPRTAEAAAAGAGAPRAIEVDVVAVKPLAQEVEMKAAEASVAPLVQGLPLLRESAWEAEVQPISSDDTFQVHEVVDAGVASTVEQPAPTPGEGSLALVRSRDDPEGEPLFALEDAAEGWRWDTFEQYRQLAERSLRTTLSVVADDLPEVAQELETRSLGKLVFLRQERDVWDQLQRQKDLLARANKLLSAWSVEVEDLHLRGIDMEAAAATAGGDGPGEGCPLGGAGQGVGGGVDPRGR
ncbi:uncharacterized protein [Miscanthus floridulus]|uniref:uncharacterized protein n=1 Tax=Miscanthus floridulus TaxID=154761 RepID=UPI003458BB40